MTSKQMKQLVLYIFQIAGFVVFLLLSTFSFWMNKVGGGFIYLFLAVIDVFIIIGRVSYEGSQDIDDGKK